jgi:hypothetical protein
MTDPIDQVLRLVAEGRLTAEEAAPVLDALQGLAGEAGNSTTGGDDPAAPGGSSATSDRPRARALLVEVSEGGRKAVHLRVPLSIGQMALDHIPGLSTDNIERIRRALDQGMTGPILIVDEDGDGDGVRIVLE